MLHYQNAPQTWACFDSMEYEKHMDVWCLANHPGSPDSSSSGSLVGALSKGTKQNVAQGVLSASSSGARA